MPSLLFLGWLALAGWGIGRLCLRALMGQARRALPPSLTSLWSLALGWGVLAYAVLAIGSLGGLTRWAGGTLLAAGTLWALWEWRQAGNRWRSPLVWFISRRDGTQHEATGAEGRKAKGKRQRQGATTSQPTHPSSPQPTNWPTNAALVVVAFILLATLVSALAPPTSIDWDDLTYHLAAPKVFLAQGRIAPLAYDSHSHFPFTLEMLYTLALLFSGAGAAKAIHWCTHTFAVSSLFLFGRRIGRPEVGALAALVYVSIPQAVWESGTAYVELAQGWYQWLALWGFLEFAGWLPEPLAQTDRPKVLLPTAILCGFALGIKMMSLLIIGWIGVGLLVHGLGQMRRGEAKPGPLVGRLLAFSVIALLVGSPWYLRSYLLTGNPFFPFFHELFPSPLWSADRAADYRAAQLAFGHGRSLLQLLRLPWALTFQPAPFFDRGQSPQLAAIGPAFLAFGPLAVVGLFTQAARREKQQHHSGPASGREPLATAGCAFRLPPSALCESWLLLTVLVWTLAWFFTMQYVRYLLPTLLVGSLLVGRGYTYAVEHSGRFAVGVKLLFALTPLYGGSLAAMLAADAAPVVFGLLPERAYLRQRLDSYPAWEFVNTSLPPSATILTLGEPRCFYSDRSYLWGERGHSTLIPYDTFRTPEQLLRYLRQELGVTHVLINLRWISLEGPSWATLYRKAWREEGLLKPVYATRDGKVWVLEVASR